jgi:hypothetical protein
LAGGREKKESGKQALFAGIVILDTILREDFNNLANGPKLPKVQHVAE